MRLLETKKQENKIILLLTITYTVSYITRINYGSIIAEMEAITKISRELLSMAVTGSFFSYGIGQVISGILGDRFSPRKLVHMGLIVTVLMNLLIPLCFDPYQLVIVWTINGFAQSFMWPPMVRLMNVLLSQEGYNRASVIVSWGSAFGTILVYLFAPIIISLAGWKAVFVCAAGCGIVMVLIWWKLCPDLPKQPVCFRTDMKENTSRHFITPLMLCIMITVILQGMLRDSVTTWMPTYISDTYHLSTGVSILSGVVLPVFTFMLHPSLCMGKVGKEIRSLPQPVVISGTIQKAAIPQNVLRTLSGSSMISSCRVFRHHSSFQPITHKGISNHNKDITLRFLFPCTFFPNCQPPISHKF